MGGINSLSGLNKVSVDFRPAITTTGQNNGNANQLLPEVNVAPEEGAQGAGQARSVVRELDVLLLNAAGKSVASDAAGNVKTVGDSLRDLGVLTKKEASKLESLAEDAAAKLKALDKFSGRDLAKALMQDKKTGETVWSKGFFGLNAAAKAVKSAIEAQQKLSAELGRFANRLAGNALVDPAKQEQYTELLFQCDRRASEIDSVVFRMYDLARKDVVNGAADDPQTKALLDATFNELMPREAILMHGTAEAFEKLNETMGAQLRPLAEKLDAFAANGGQVLGKEELRALLRDMATMKNAIANVRANGIEVTHAGKDGTTYVTRTEVDKSLLAKMEEVLDNASYQISRAKKTSVYRAREAFLQEVKTSLTPVDARGQEVWGSGASDSVLTELAVRRNELVRTLGKFATGEKPMKDFDATVDACIAKFRQELFENLENRLPQQGVDPIVAQGISKTLGGLHIVKAQFKEMIGLDREAAERRRGGRARDKRRAPDHARRDGAVERRRGEGAGLQAGGRRSRHGGVEHRIFAAAGGRLRGQDLPAGDEVRRRTRLQARSRRAPRAERNPDRHGWRLPRLPELGEPEPRHAGHRQGVRLRGRRRQVFRRQPQRPVRLVHGEGEGRLRRRFLEEIRLGRRRRPARRAAQHHGPRRAYEDQGLRRPAAQQADVARPHHRAGRPPLEQLLHPHRPDHPRGNGQRHRHRRIVRREPHRPHEVRPRQGADRPLRAGAEGRLPENPRQRLEGRTRHRVSQDPAIVRSGGTITIDLARARTHEAKMALIGVLGLQSVALPEEIDRDFYDHLMEMEADPAKKQAYLDTIPPRISPAALRATETRLDEAIAHARKLAQNGKVYGKAQWQNEDNLNAMTGSKATLTITKADGSKFKAENTIECVRDYNQRKCPSFYKREFLHKMFDPPE